LRRGSSWSANFRKRRCAIPDLNRIQRKVGRYQD
jgi:hypothetical protein